MEVGCGGVMQSEVLGLRRSRLRLRFRVSDGQPPISISRNATARPHCTTPLQWGISPEELILAWPESTRLACLYSSDAAETGRARLGGGETNGASRWSRWSVFVPLSPAAAITPSSVGSHVSSRRASLAVVRTLTDADLRSIQTEEGRIAAVREFLDALTPTADVQAAAFEQSKGDAPQTPMVLLFASYELGRVLEPTVARASGRQRWGDESGATKSGAKNDGHELPLITAVQAQAAIVHDRVTNSWSILAASDQAQRDFEAFVASIDTSADAARPHPHSANAPYTLGPLVSAMGADAYKAAVRRAVEYIRDGDVFQVNLAHALEASFEGSTRRLFVDLSRSARPWFGAYAELENGDRCTTVLSVSPELFLDFDPADRRITTRPIKGTRPSTAPERELFDAPKDRAELNMIIDLMRNDLGRVSEYGSVRVQDARAIETHAVAQPDAQSSAAISDAASTSSPGGVRHAVATITGRLAPQRTITDLLCAAFPGGSITGAPKVRAMQIIEELEPSPRGLYCGSIALLDGRGHHTASIAIRTATVSGDRFRFPVGAGIVADSIAESEWLETLDKAGAVFRLVRG